MKALMLKDALVLKKQSLLFIILIFVFSVMPSETFSGFGIMYAVLLSVTAIAYDEAAKWDALAAMMPYSVKDIVLSKYLLSYIFIFLAVLLAFASKLIVALVSRTPFAPGGIVLSHLPSAAVALIIAAIDYPLVFRFGSEKGRYIYLFATVIIAVFATSLLGGAADALPSFLGSAVFPAVLFAAGAVCNIISIPLSVKLYIRRNRT